MALFNKKNFENLMAELSRGDDLIESLKSLAVLSIPLETAKEHMLMGKMRALAPYLQMTDLCSTIMGKLMELQKEEKKAKAKREAVNERRKLNYKRKREAEKGIQAKKVKMSDLKQLEHSTNVQQEVTGKARNPAAAVTKKDTPTLKTTGPKKVAQKPTLLRKATKDALKIKKQFK
ncbi:unnamed protein product [Caenorhabditis brenneri]